MTHLLWIGPLTLLLGGLGGYWLYLRSRRQASDADARREAEVRASIEAFRAEMAAMLATEEARRASLIEEEALRDPPNSDLPLGDVRERLLRAAEDAGGPEARTRLETLLDARAAAGSRSV